ncbi:MAG: site-2 protease family protein [Armatimonadota bacterium]|nr:site-2 protease family protein [bacterium]
MPRDFNLYQFVLSMIALIICITIHEFAHAYSAWRAGDDTPKLQGRISLNPIDHLDPIGTVMMVLSSISGFGIGWGKPVRINPGNFHSPRWGNFWVSLWGPLANLFTAMVAGVILRLLGASMPGNVFHFVLIITFISITLAIFNLIPIAPLDGSHILSSLLPREHAIKYDMFMGRYGFLIFLALIFLLPDVLPAIMGPPSRFLLHLFVGV